VQQREEIVERDRVPATELGQARGAVVDLHDARIGAALAKCANAPTGEAEFTASVCSWEQEQHPDLAVVERLVGRVREIADASTHHLATRDAHADDVGTTQ
jgi:hypothetical protein